MSDRRKQIEAEAERYSAISKREDPVATIEVTDQQLRTYLIEACRWGAEWADKNPVDSGEVGVARWYKDRDFPEVKTSNSDIVAVIENPKQLGRVINDYNALRSELAIAKAELAAERDKLAKLREALLKIASCRVVFDGDCPSIASKVLAETKES